MNRCPVALLCAFLLTLSGGCQSPPSDEDYRVARPLPYRIYLYVDESATASETKDRTAEETEPVAHNEKSQAGEQGDEEQDTEPESSGPIPVLPADLRGIEEDVAAASRAHDLCTEILRPDPSRSWDREAALADARDERADLFLRIDSRGPPRYRFSHNGAWFLPNTLLWFVLGFPSFWVSDRVYEIEWPVSVHIHSVTGDKETPEEETLLAPPRSFALQKQVPLSVHERGFSAQVLYTPPGFYDGPEVGKVLKPHAETLLVDEVVRLLRNDQDESTDGVDLFKIVSPKNLSTVDVEGTDLRISFLGDAPLLRLRLELDGRILEERDAISLPDLLESGPLPDGRAVPELEMALSTVLERVDHLRRIPPRDTTRWTATKTIRFWTEQREHRLRVLVRTSELARSR